MKKSLFKNLRLQSYLQLLSTIIPLVTTPYVARVLGPENSGVYSFNHSIASFFSLFALLGTSNYGTRKIAESKNEEEKYLNFWSIYSIQVCTVLISTILYIIYCLLFCQFGTIRYYFIITLVGCLFNIQWYYYGCEEFALTTLAHAICRVCLVLFLFLFVNKSSDLIIYTMIMVGFEALAFVLLWCGKFFGNKIPFRKITFKDVIVHIKPNLLLFVPVLAITIYQVMDRIMIGVFSSSVQGGYYYNTEKIINVPLGLFTGFSTVLLPRMTIMYSDNKGNAIKFFNKSLSLLLMFGTAVSFGIISVSKEFVPIFLGAEYLSCIPLVNIFAPVLIIKCISNAVRTQLLIPAKMDKIYIKATLFGTVVNFLANALFIPELGALGAVIGTIVSETVSLIYQLFFTRKEVDITKIIVECIIFSGFGLVMLLAVRLTSTCDLSFFSRNGNTIALIKMLLEVLVGASVYILLSIFYSLITKNMVYDYLKKFRIKINEN